MNLIIYTNTGNTYFFGNVTGFTKTATGFEFDYTGKASGKVSRAVFNSVSTAGYAMQPITDKGV